MSSWPSTQLERTRRRWLAPPRVCRSWVPQPTGLPSGLKTACGIASRRPCGPDLTPETTAAPDGKHQGPGSSLPRRYGTQREAADRVWLARKGSSTGIVETIP